MAQAEEKMKAIEIIETPVFTEDIDKLLGPDEYRALQLELIERPTRGKLIAGTGGARKMRFAIAGKGKSGGIRIIYYYQVEKIYLLLAYKKAKQEDLTPKQQKILKSFIERIK